MNQRLFRRPDAASYLGMSATYFDSKVRPSLPLVRIGKRGVAFDIVDLDAWADQHKDRNGLAMNTGVSTWEAQERGESPSNLTVLGPSTRSGKATEFLPDLAKSRRKTLKNGSARKLKDSGQKDIVSEVLALCSQMAQHGS